MSGGITTRNQKVRLKNFRSSKIACNDKESVLLILAKHFNNSLLKYKFQFKNNGRKIILIFCVIAYSNRLLTVSKDRIDGVQKLLDYIIYGFNQRCQPLRITRSHYGKLQKFSVFYGLRKTRIFLREFF